MNSPDKTTAITTDLAERAMGARRPQYFLDRPASRAAFTPCLPFRGLRTGLSSVLNSRPALSRALLPTP